MSRAIPPAASSLDSCRLLRARNHPNPCLQNVDDASVALAATSLSSPQIMAPHLTPKELQAMLLRRSAGKSPIQICAWLEAIRKRKGIPAPHLTAVRKALSGKSHKMGLPETRGRKRKLTRKQVLKLNTVRKTLLKKADGQTKVTYSQILRKGRLAMNVSPTTLAKNFQTEGVDVKWRPAREGQVLDGKAKAERMAICNKWKFLASDYFPTQNAAFKSLKRGKVRGHLRTRPEGTTDHCKRPHPRKNRVNPGGSVTVCAAIIAGKLRMWHYLDKGKWNGAVAASMYKGPLLKALRRCHGELPRYIILEDNDPSGFKSRKGETAKKEAGIKTVPFPKYSPDLNPLDFYVWAAVEEKVISKLKGPTSVSKFRRLLTAAARGMKEETILAAVASIKDRAKAVVAAKGGAIARD